MTHQTVFLQLAIDYLQVKKDAWYLDATFGGGGHSREILNRGGKVLAFEYDSVTYEQIKPDFQEFIDQGRLILLCQNFAKLQKVITALPEFGADFRFAGILFDFGTNSDQLMSGERGLSVSQSGPLDMRLDQTLAITARDLLMVLSEKQLTQLFFTAGGELEGHKIARAIVFYRQKHGQEAFLDASELSDLVKKTKRSHSHLHPATKVFQALRLAVNGEIDNLTDALPQAFHLLASGGHLVTIAFHEGEDRPVKQFFQQLVNQNQGLLLTKRPLTPEQEELQQNPRARSAKLRVIEKIN